MSTARKEFLRNMINEGNLKTAGDLHLYLKDMFKDALQEMLEAELEIELGYSKGDKKNKNTDNRRNGYSQKTVKTEFGEIPLEIPRDREGDFEPMVVPKHKRDILGIEEKVISLYGRGMSTRDINQVILSLVVQAEKALGSGTGDLKYIMVVENVYKVLYWVDWF